MLAEVVEPNETTNRALGMGECEIAAQRGQPLFDLLAATKRKWSGPVQSAIGDFGISPVEVQRSVRGGAFHKVDVQARDHVDPLCSAVERIRKETEAGQIF